MRTTILRKKIKPISAKDASEVERVVFCSDPRQVKNFNKRKHKHETKSRRSKKTSFKEKVKAAKPLFDDGGGYREARESDTSSLWNKGTPSNYTEPLRI